MFLVSVVSLVPRTFHLLYKGIILKRHIQKQMLTDKTELFYKPWKNTQIRHGFEVLFVHLWEAMKEGLLLSLSTLELHKLWIHCLLYFNLWWRRKFTTGRILCSQFFSRRKWKKKPTKQNKKRISKKKIYSLTPSATYSILHIQTFWEYLQQWSRWRICCIHRTF